MESKNTCQEAGGKKPQRKLRTACDSCHQTKVRCSKGKPCQTCATLDLPCVYSVSNRIGRPRGTKNKRTIERQNREMAAEAIRAEAEKNKAYRAVNGSMVTSPTPRHPNLSINSSNLSSTCPPGMDGMFAMGMPNSMSHDLAMPLSAPPIMNMADQPWATQVSDAQTASWLQSVPVHPASLPHSSLANPYDPVIAGDFDVVSSGWADGLPPQSCYLTPGSSRRGTDSRTSPECQQRPPFEDLPQMQHISPPDSAASGLSRRSSMVAQSTPMSLSFTEASLMGAVRCQCLTTQTEVLFRFKRLSIDPPPRLDVLLDYAKQGISAWKAILHCDVCRLGSDQDTLELCTMSISSFIRSLERTNLGATGLDQSYGASDSTLPAGRLRGNSIDSCISEVAMSRVGSNQSHSTTIDFDSFAGQGIVNKVYLCKALAQVKEVIAALRQTIELRPSQGYVMDLSATTQPFWNLPQAGYPVSVGGPMQDMSCEKPWGSNGSMECGSEMMHLLARLKGLETAVHGLSGKLKAQIMA